MESRKAERQELVREFGALYGGTEGALAVVSPGRVNLIGEHTDYNGGPVMPIAIDLCVEMVFRKRDDDKVVMRSHLADEPVEFSLNELEPMKNSGWGGYAAGVCAMLRDFGFEPCGMEALAGGNLPLGIGLSSSAALEVAVAAAQVHLSGADISRLDIARICQKAEHEFAGVRCGIMDQFAAAVGSSSGPVFLDCRTMEYRELPLEPQVAVVVTDSKIRHLLGDSEYNVRRSQCEEAVSILSKHIKGLKFLAQLPLGEFKLLAGELPPVVARRAKHVITETKRAREAARALCESNPLQVGVLMNASHVSLRDDYEVSCKELDILAQTAWDTGGVFGARMTGGGFGGCTVCLMDRERVDAYREGISAAYEEKTGLKPDIYVCRPHNGATVTRVG